MPLDYYSVKMLYNSSKIVKAIKSVKLYKCCETLGGFVHSLSAVQVLVTLFFSTPYLRCHSVDRYQMSNMFGGHTTS